MWKFLIWVLNNQQTEMFNIGIDLGTTNSAMAVYEDESETIEMIENFEGETTTPSVVQVLEDDVVVGENALADQVRYPDRTMVRTKRDMGTDTVYEIDGTEYPPERIAGYILEKLKDDAEDRFDEAVDGAVITVPYYFGSAARTATENAGEGFADLRVYRTMNEPTAACYAYGYQEEEDETLLVYDLGGGTFDATLIEVSEDDIEAKESNGDTDLGGENFDDTLYEHVRQELLDKGASDPSEDKYKQTSLREDVKEAKELLSTSQDAAISYQTDEMYDVEISRSEFQELTTDLVDKTIELVDDLFTGTDYAQDDIDNVLMVGGSTRMPHVRDAVEEYFGMEPSTDTNPDEIVAKGAALEAALYGDDLPVDSGSLTDILSHSLGVETHNENGPNKFDPILEEGEPLPDTNTEPYGNPDDEKQDLIVNIIQGEHEEANHEENEELGQFVLEDVPGDTKLNVEFFITEDGQLEVTAEAENREIEGGIEVSDGIGLSEKEMGDIEDETTDYESKAVKRRGEGD